MREIHTLRMIEKNGTVSESSAQSARYKETNRHAPQRAQNEN